MAHQVKFESDIEPLERVLMDNYSLKKAPKLKVGFIDIEVDYSSKIGFSSPKNPYAPINAVTICYQATGTYKTFAVPPKSWVENGIKMTKLPNKPALAHVELCVSESELLRKFLDAIHDLDVLSGWNSEFFDLPYIGKRLELVFGESALTRLGFEDGPKPRWGERDRFKGAREKDLVLNIQSRVHLDYMRLYKKFNIVSKPSYKLDAIGFDEVKIQKLHYNGTLEELYNNEFSKFCEYNVHDTTILLELDRKLKYIELANQMVHMATVNFEAVFGSVQLIDSAIINYAHDVLKLIVFDRQVRPDSDPVEGAIVVSPIPGLYDNVASVDIGSLYPNTIRSLNLSPEKIIGQLLAKEADWHAFYEGRRNPTKDSLDVVVHLQLNGERDAMEITVGDLIRLCTEQKYAVSGYGTILDQSSGEGLLPAVLSSWYNGRKQMQAKKKEYAKAAEELLKAGLSKEHEDYIELVKQAEYYDMLQGVRKVLLNSTYGALLNEYMRFGDPRLGASTTYSGRQVTTHMFNVISESLCTDGEPATLQKEVVPEHVKKRTGETITSYKNVYTIDLKGQAGPVYGDTDSCYFTMRGLTATPDESIALADAIADIVNEAFPQFMMLGFNCQSGYENHIKANREYVFDRGILQAKKKYMMRAIDKEGKRIAPGSDDELKTQGSDIKLSSTPEQIRMLLKTVVLMILGNEPREAIDKYIIDFRTSLQTNTGVNPLDLSITQSIKELDEYQLKWERIEKAGLGKVNLPSNTRATINYNYMLEKLDLKGTTPIISGSKIKTLWLKENPMGFTNIAIPGDLEELPAWFDEHFEIDIKKMEDKLVDGKLQLIFDALGWEVPTFQTQKMKLLLNFDE
jgi:DNA polymerase elongation subunit (family B)